MNKAATQQLVDSYHMSVAEAFSALCPCGKDKGKLMKDINNKSMYWLANQTTTMRNKTEFRMAVKAARIIREYRRDEKKLKTVRDVIGRDVGIDDAKRARCMCNSCGAVALLWRNLLDRAKVPACDECGGTMVASGIVAEWMTLREASEWSGLSYQHLLNATKNGTLVSSKNQSNRIIVTPDSVERLKVGVGPKKQKYGSSKASETRERFCGECNKHFRSLAAWRLHMRDHEAKV